jgi:predicted MFS family arabinose efflux permease
MKERQAAFGTLFIVFFGIGYSVLFSTYGTWLNEEYGLDSESVGFSSIVVGMGEFSGALSATLLIDRLSPTRSGFLGGSNALFMLIVLGFVCNTKLAVGLAILFILLLSAEFCILSSISLYTTVGPPHVSFFSTVCSG